jgi:hypothetical protein
VPNPLDVAQLSLLRHGGEQQESDVDTAASVAPKASARGTNASDIPRGEITEPILITETKYQRMRGARGGQVESEVDGLKNALVELSSTTKTNSRT